MLVVILVASHVFCLVAFIFLVYTVCTGLSIWSWSQIFHIGTVIFFDIILACLILWNISIFHFVAHANILGADCSSISSISIAKYFESCWGIINDQSEYNSVTVSGASVIFTIRFCPWSCWWRSVLRSNHNSLMIYMMPANTRSNTSAFCFTFFCGSTVFFFIGLIGSQYRSHSFSWASLNFSCSLWSFSFCRWISFSFLLCSSLSFLQFFANFLLIKLSHPITSWFLSSCK